MDEQIIVQTTLRNKLMDFKHRNPAFSLRAFANKLDLSPSALSEILNGKRKISEKMALKIFSKLGLDPIEKNEVLSHFKKAQNIDGENLKELEQKRYDELKFLELTADQFYIIGKWHHFAILSLIETKDFKANVSWIATRLNLTKHEAQLALERLERLELITWNKRKKLIELTHGPLITSDDVTNSAVRNSHYEDLKLAEKVLDNVPVDLRDFTAVTIAVDSKKIQKAKKMIREFQDKLSQYLESGEKDEVYKITFYLYPLSQQQEEK